MTNVKQSAKLSSLQNCNKSKITEELTKHQEILRELKTKLSVSMHASKFVKKSIKLSLSKYEKFNEEKEVG